MSISLIWPCARLRVNMDRYFKPVTAIDAIVTDSFQWRQGEMFSGAVIRTFTGHLALGTISNA